MKKTKKSYVEFLNGLYHFESIMDNDPYLIKKPSDKRLATQGKYGDLLKKNDPIAFNVGYNEWQP